MAPEVHAGQGHDFQSDVWSAGVVLYVMVHGYLPFRGVVKDLDGNFLKEEEQFRALGEEITANRYLVDEDLSWGCKDLIRRILNLECPPVPEPPKDADANEVQPTPEKTRRLGVG